MEPMFDMKTMANLFKALGDENRLHILDILGDQEVCACVLLEELSISQPTLSHHMKLLVDTGLVTARKDGRWIKYTLNKPGLHAAQLAMASLMVSEGVPCICGKESV